MTDRLLLLSDDTQKDDLRNLCVVVDSVVTGEVLQMRFVCSITMISIRFVD
jgi:hypothetical protein